MPKSSFKLIRKWRERRHDLLTHEPYDLTGVEYEASFWEGPVEPGTSGEYRMLRLKDYWDGQKFYNSQPSLSYYPQLKRVVTSNA